MPETPLEYDKIIWTVFSIGIVSSVIILYTVNYGNINDIFGKILALTLGFVIWAYSFMLTLGYNKKKRNLVSLIKTNNYLDETIELTKDLVSRLHNENYARVRWIGEIILGLIGVYYLISFTFVEIYFITIPIIITLLFILLSCLANVYKPN